MTDNKIRTNTQNAGHLLAIFSWVISFIIGTVILSVLMVDFFGEEFEKPNSDFWPIMAACVALVAVILITARGLKHHKQWSRYVGGFLAVLTLAAFPVGTILGIFVLSNLVKGWNEN